MEDLDRPGQRYTKVQPDNLHVLHVVAERGKSVHCFLLLIKQFLSGFIYILMVTRFIVYDNSKMLQELEMCTIHI